MSKIQWEYDLVEKPFCEQLRAMGWQWLEGDTDVPELTERESFREVLLRDRLTAALRKLNLRDGQPWQDDARIARAMGAQNDITEWSHYKVYECTDVWFRISSPLGSADSGATLSPATRPRWYQC
jgi:hypothetical protein